jgi:hypothetical protein
MVKLDTEPSLASLPIVKACHIVLFRERAGRVQRSVVRIDLGVRILVQTSSVFGQCEMLGRLGKFCCLAACFAGCVNLQRKHIIEGIAEKTRIALISLRG